MINSRQSVKVTFTNPFVQLFSDGPVFKTRPKPVEADLDQIATLTCDVDGNPPADIVWIHEPTEKVTSPNSFFVF